MLPIKLTGFRCLFIIIFACLLAYAQPEIQRTGGEPSIDWIFLVDTSGSMEGKAEGTNIFPEVKRAIKNFMQSTYRGDSVTIFTFDTQTVRRDGNYIGTQVDKDFLSGKIDGYEAHGLYTHTGEAVYEALKRQKDLQTPPDPNRKVFIVLLTDGVEDIRDKPHALRLKDVQIPPEEMRPYTIIVWLGKEKREFEQSPLNEFKKKFAEKGAVLFYPEASSIANLVDDIKSKFPRQPVIHTGEIYFGDVELGGTSGTKIISASCLKEAEIQLLLDDKLSQYVQLSTPNPIKLKEGQNDLRLSLTVKKNAPLGKLSGQLSVKTIGQDGQDQKDVAVIKAIPIEINVIHVSVLIRTLRYLAVFGLAIIGLIAAICIRYGEPPHVLYKMIRSRSYLFGSLLIEKIGGRGAVKKKNLSELKTKAVRLRFLLAGLDIELDEFSDVELVVLRDKGEKILRLRNPQGRVIYNEDPLSHPSEVDIFNGDVIEIGDSVKITYDGGNNRKETFGAT